MKEEKIEYFCDICGNEISYELGKKFMSISEYEFSEPIYLGWKYSEPNSEKINLKECFRFGPTKRYGHICIKCIEKVYSFIDSITTEEVKNKKGLKQ